MMITPKQLILPINEKTPPSLGEFYPGKNQLLLNALASKQLFEHNHLVYLWGESGTGRSYLLQAMCQAYISQGKQAAYLPCAQFSPLGPNVFDELSKLALVCIDDIEVIAGNYALEEAFFRFYHLAQDNQTQLLIAANTPYQGLALCLEDLRSRFASGISFQLQPLDESDKRRLLQERAYAKGLQLPEESVDFIMNHCSRNTKDLCDLLEKLDQAAWEKQHRLTIPFIKRII